MELKNKKAYISVVRRSIWSMKKAVVIILGVLLVAGIAAGFFLTKLLQPDTPSDVFADFAKDTLRSEWLPEKLEVVQGVSTSGTMQGTGYSHGIQWEINEFVLHGVVHYHQYDYSRVQDIGILVELPGFESITAARTKAEIERFFLTPADSINCRQTDFNATICERFWQGDDGSKRGVGMVSSPAGQDTFLFACELPPSSDKYGSFTSCTAFG